MCSHDRMGGVQGLRPVAAVPLLARLRGAHTADDHDPERMALQYRSQAVTRFRTWLNQNEDKLYNDYLPWVIFGAALALTGLAELFGG